MALDSLYNFTFSLSFLKWNDFYRISELMLSTLIQRYDQKSFHFFFFFFFFFFLIKLKNEGLTEILQAVRYHI